MRDPIDDAERAWIDGVDPSPARVLQAIEGFDRDRAARDRARTVGIGRLVVLLIGVAFVLALVLTLNQLITDAVQGIDEGLDQGTQQPG